MKNQGKSASRARPEARTAKLKYEKPQVKKQGDLKKITALSFQPPG